MYVFVIFWVRVERVLVFRDFFGVNSFIFVIIIVCLLIFVILFFILLVMLS